LFFVQLAGILLSASVVGKDKSRLWCLRGTELLVATAGSPWNADRRRVQGQEYRRYKEAILR